MRDKLTDKSHAISARADEALGALQIGMCVRVQNGIATLVPADPENGLAGGKLLIARGGIEKGKRAVAYEWVNAAMSDIKTKPGTALFLGHDGRAIPFRPKKGIIRQVGMAVEGGVILDVRPGAWAAISGGREPEPKPAPTKPAPPKKKSPVRRKIVKKE